MCRVICISDDTPSRGWYSLYPFVLSETVDYGQLKWSIKNYEYLVLARINLYEFRDSDIDDAALDNLSRMFDFFRTYKKEIILRFVYDIDGNGLMNEPESIKIIKRHMQQVAPYIIKNHDIILTMQGVFIGSWGEMHTSRYADSADIADLVITLYEAVKGSVNIALRKPSQIRELVQFLDATLYPDKEKVMKRIGLYDDAMLSTDTDMGTFSYDNLDGDMKMLKELSSINAIGGEAVSGDIDLDEPEVSIEGLKKRYVTYLNSQYDPEAVGKWEKQYLYDEHMTAYKYITEHLGYRLEYRGMIFNPFGLRTVIFFKNTGFAPFYGKIKLLINENNQSTQKLEAISNKDIIKPGETVKFVFKKKWFPWQLYLTGVRVSDGKSVGLYRRERDSSGGI